MTNIDKYFCSQAMVDYLMDDINGGKFPRKERFISNMKRPNPDIANALTTNEGSRPVSTFIKYKIGKQIESGDYLLREDDNKQEYVVDSYNKQLTDPSISGTIVAGQAGNQGSMILQKYKIPLKRGYDAEIIDEQEVCDGVDIIGNYSKSDYGQTPIVGKNGLAPTVTENHGQVTAIVEKTEPKVIGGVGDKKSNKGRQWYEQDRIYEAEIATSVATSGHPNYAVPIKNATKDGYLLAEDGDGIDVSSRMETHRGTVQKGIAQTIKTTPDVGVLEMDGQFYAIRKLTSRECFRLMGFDDVDYDNAAKVVSERQRYKQAGNGIVVNVLEAIFGQLYEEE